MGPVERKVLKGGHEDIPEGAEVLQEILRRMAEVSDRDRAKWGTMSAHQMLRHWPDSKDGVRTCSRLTMGWQD
jgi:hypothetical protein